MASEIEILIQKKREEAAKLISDAEQYELIVRMLGNAELRKVVEKELGVVKPTRKGRPAAEGESENMKLIRSYMVQHANAPITLKALSEAVGLGIPVIRQVMSKTQAFTKKEILPTKEGKYVLTNP